VRALEALKKDRLTSHSVDVNMAGKDGVWLAWRIREQFPQTAIIMASLVRDVETAVCSLRNSVVDYLLKPFDSVGFARRCRSDATGTPRQRATRSASSVCRTGCGARRASLAPCSPRPRRRTRRRWMGLISMLHSTNVTAAATRVVWLDCTLAVAEELGSTDERTLTLLEHGALLHDIGKLDVPFFHPHQVSPARR
jgi:response regulator RpfG family c-di-GMP phosphodiesterase